MLKGKYRLEHRLGAGGFGSVYAARHALTETWHAVKLLHGPLATVPEIKQRLREEARMGMQLQHPRIVRVTDFDSEGDIFFLVMDLVESQTLSQVIEQDPERVAGSLEGWARDIAAALDYAHAKGVVHRDLKPSNVLVRDEDSAALLSDFGIARWVHQAGLTQPGTTLGTYAYMSPEQCRGEDRTLDGRSDIYSFAALLFELVTGRPPFGFGPEAVQGHQLADPPMASQLQPGLPVGVDEVLARGLAKVPDERYQSAATLARDLATEVVPPVPPTVVVVPSPTRQTHEPAVSGPGPVREPPPEAWWRRLGLSRLVAAGALLAILVVILAYLGVRALAPPASRPGVVLSTLVLTADDLPGYAARPPGEPGTLPPSTYEATFQSTGDPPRVIVSVAALKGSDQEAIDGYAAARGDNLAQGLGEQPPPPLGQQTALLNSDRSTVLLWREGRVVCQIAAPSSVTGQEITALGQRQDARVRAALGG